MAVNYQYSRYEINMVISSDNQHGFFNIDNQIFVNSQWYKFQHWTNYSQLFLYMLLLWNRSCQLFCIYMIEERMKWSWTI